MNFPVFYAQQKYFFMLLHVLLCPGSAYDGSERLILVETFILMESDGSIQASPCSSVNVAYPRHVLLFHSWVW